MGWGNPVVGGTVLTIAAIESPNFSVPGSSGWAIMQNGQAYFFQVTLTGDVILTGSGAVLVYNGTPALGTLIASIASGPFTDPVSNAVLSGVVSYQPHVGSAFALQVTSGGIQFWSAPGSGGPWTATGPAITQSNGLQLSSGNPGGAGVNPASLGLSAENPIGVGVMSGSLGLAEQAAPSSGLVPSAPQLFGSNATGMVRFVSDQTTLGGHGDQQAYDTGRQTKVIAANVPITSTTPATLLTFNVAAITYRIAGYIPLSMGAVASAAVVSFAGTATVAASGMRVRNNWQAAVNFGGDINTGVNARELSGFGNNPSPTLTASTGYELFFDGTISFSAAGTLLVTAQEGTAGDSWTVDAPGYVELLPVG